MLANRQLPDVCDVFYARWMRDGEKKLIPMIRPALARPISFCITDSAG